MYVILRHIISRSAPSVQLFFWSILCELLGRAFATLPVSDLVISIPVERLPLCLAIYRAFPLEESALEGKEREGVEINISQINHTDIYCGCVLYLVEAEDDEGEEE